MAKRINGAGVNRTAARRASEVAALRRARLVAHELAVTEAVAVFFDRSGRADAVREEAQQRAQCILADAEDTAVLLTGEADAAVAALKKLGEPVSEIATMVDLPVSGVRAALARADQHQPENASAPVGLEPEPEPVRATADRPLGDAGGDGDLPPS